MTSESSTPTSSRIAQARAKFDALPYDVREYLIVFALLMAMLLLTVIAALPDFGAFINLAIAMTIAIIKAVLVVLFFMHVKQASRVTWVFAGSAFLWLGIMIALILADYGTRRNQPGAVNEAPAVQFMHAQQSPG